MPVYEFHCKDCRHEFKTLRRAEKLADVSCPECGTEKVVRLLSVTARTSAEDTAAGACAMPAMSGCMGNPSACGCRLN